MNMKLSTLFHLLSKRRRLCRNYTVLLTKGPPSVLNGHVGIVDLRIRNCVNDSDVQHRKPGRCVIQVMGNGNDGSARAVLVRDVNQSHLFNCGEGFSRFAVDHRIKFARIKNFFVTYNSWQNLGGLPCSLLSMNSFLSSITLHGPPNVEELLNITKRFVDVQNLKIEKREFSKPPFDTGSGMTVEYVPLFGTHQLEGKRDVSVAYICKIKSTTGRLLIEKCVEFGVPPGPLLQDLRNGLDITLPDGNVVRSDDVHSFSHPRATFIVVECPNKNFLSPLLEAQEFRAYQHGSKSADDNCEVIVHFTPSDILEHNKYQQWMKRFPKDVTHLVVNESCPGYAAVEVHTFQEQLRLLHEGIFPSLPVEQKSKRMEFPGIHNVILCEPLTEYYLQSTTPGIDRSKVLSIELDNKKSLQMMKNSPEVVEALECLKSNSLYASSNPLIKASSYPEIVFLGTSATVATRRRNCVSTLIHLSEDKAILLDCGEGTFTQIVRMYGQQKAKHILRKLTAIFVSHMHADHHLGLVRLLLERRKAFDELKLTSDYQRLHLVYSPKITYWLKHFDSLFEPIVDQFRIVSFEDLLHNRRTMDTKIYRQLLWDIGLKDISAEHVIHFATPYGMILTLQNGWKVVYSGDTMPCDKLIEAGEGCDVLLHEATMEDEMINEAREKRHSTISDAMEVGQKMRAKYTILTHISSRYKKIPFITEKLNETVGVAYDFMKITKDTLPIIPYFVPCLKIMYSDQHEFFQFKSDQRHFWRVRNEERLRRES